MKRERTSGRPMLIGDLAARSGVSRHTIRFYEREGVLPEPARTPSGYRRYGPAAVERLEFIGKAKALGLRLEDIREVVEISSGGRAPCEHVRRAIVARLEEVDARLAELRELRATLRGTLDLLDEAPPLAGACPCPVIDRATPDATAVRP
ncbi:MAG: heavy metal-responsive transcriptional regulator [Gemmatimonadota bacterium]